MKERPGLRNLLRKEMAKKIRALYCREDYNAFDERSEAGYYEIVSDVPEDMTDEEIEEEAKKPCAIKSGHRFIRIEKI